jgi:diguanylate cyclase (GGDEF)-like protein
MAQGRVKSMLSADVQATNALSNIPTLWRAILSAPSADHAERAESEHAEREHAERELAQLRIVNARLMRELAALQLRAAEALRLADRDGLTGLYNRRRMLELLNDAIADAAQQRQFVGLLFVDLNGFKAVNDFYGHAAGDRILTTVATRISARVRTADIVCRYGGDEFVVVLPNLADARCLARVADAVRERVALPYWIQGQEQHLSAAIGESIYPRDGVDAETLLHRADQNMYRLKSRSEHSSAHLSAAATAPQALDRRRDDKTKSSGGGDP